jgi:DNA sulfur modification protein DndB
MPEWEKVKNGDLRPMEFRQEFIHSHAVVLCALGSMGQTLISTYPDDWKTRLRTFVSSPAKPPQRGTKLGSDFGG